MRAVPTTLPASVWRSDAGILETATNAYTHIQTKVIKMRKLQTAAFSGVIVLVLSACANTQGNLERETARFIGGISSEQVTVSNVDRGATDVKWKAETPAGRYNCEADDMVRRVNCVPQ